MDLLRGEFSGGVGMHTSGPARFQSFSFKSIPVPVNWTPDKFDIKTVNILKLLKDKSKVGVIFDTISIKAHWEQWCRWNCDLRVINAWKKAFSVVSKASPWHPNHVTICLLCHSGESLQNGQLELQRQNWYFAWETHKDTAISVWACQAGFWKSTGTSCQLRHAVFHGVCEIALTEVLATQVHSKKVSSFELYKFNPLLPHCRSIGQELVHCYTWGRLRIVTVRGNTVGRHS